MKDEHGFYIRGGPDNPAGFFCRFATVKPFGDAPIRVDDRVLVRPGDPRFEDDWLNAPHLAVCVDIDPELDEPSFREFHLNPKNEAVYVAGDLRYVSTVEELVPGTWTRLPW